MRLLRDIFLLGLLCTTTTLGLLQIGVVKDLLTAFERKTFDYRMAHYRGSVIDPNVGLDDVVIIDIDEKSLQELGHFSRWPRFYHASLIDTLTQAGALSIGFDILFVEPEGMSPRATQTYVKLLAHKNPNIPANNISNLLTHLNSDTLLGQSIGKSNRVFLSQSRGPNKQWLSPLPIIAKNAHGVGHVQIFPDADGVVRRLRSFIPTKQGNTPALSIQMALHALGLSWHNLNFTPQDGLYGDGWQIPTDPQGNIPLDFVGPANTFLHISYTDVLHGRIHPALFENRIVLIGASATGLMDHYPTPFSPHFPGVEIHATAIHNILTGRFITHTSTVYEWTILILIGCLVSLVIRIFKPWVSALCVALIMMGYMLICFEQFATAGVYAPLMDVVLCWILSVMVASGHRYWTEEKSKLAIKHAFSRYLAPDVVESIAANPEALGLGGDERTTTIGFIDIRNFTTLSESLTAGQLVNFLNDYLSLMTDIILKEQGTVDKYIGDAIMMLFGAPNPLTDQAERACRTALRMCQTVADHQERWQKEGMPGLAIGVGLNTGIAAVGNMGSIQRFDYTAMGDSVNLASRLEGLTKVYGVAIIVGPETEKKARNSFHFRELDFVRVKGKNEPVRIFELVATKNDGPNPTHWITPFHQGLQHFRNREWEEAQHAFHTCLILHPGDGPAHYYLDQISHLQLSPPPPNWDGISVMVHK